MAKLINPSKYHRSLDGGELLRRREGKGWSQEQLANLVSKSHQYISHLESSGEDKDWHHEISFVLAVQLEELLCS